MSGEQLVRKKVVKWARDNGVKHIRMSFRPGVQSGLPDDLFLFNGGVAVFVEFKRDDKVPTDLQLKKLGDIGELGFPVGWFDNADAAIAALTQILGAAAVYAASGTLSSQQIRSGLAPPARGSKNIDHPGGLFVPPAARSRFNDASHSAETRVPLRMAGGGGKVDAVSILQGMLPKRT